MWETGLMEFRPWADANVLEGHVSGMTAATPPPPSSSTATTTCVRCHLSCQRLPACGDVTLNPCPMICATQPGSSRML